MKSLGNKRTNNNYFPYKRAYNAYTFAKFQLRFPFKGGSGASKNLLAAGCSRIISKITSLSKYTMLVSNQIVQIQYSAFQNLTYMHADLSL